MVGAPAGMGETMNKGKPTTGKPTRIRGRGNRVVTTVNIHDGWGEPELIGLEGAKVGLLRALHDVDQTALDQAVRMFKTTDAGIHAAGIRPMQVAWMRDLFEARSPEAAVAVVSDHLFGSHDARRVVASATWQLHRYAAQHDQPTVQVVADAMLRLMGEAGVGICS